MNLGQIKITAVPGAIAMEIQKQNGQRKIYFLNLARPAYRVFYEEVGNG